MDIASIVNASFPEGLLLPRSGHNGDTDLGSVLVGPGAMIHSATGPSVTLPVNDPDGYWFSILRNDPTSSHLDILVPGFGHGLVERAVCQTIQHQSYSHKAGIRSRVRDIWIDDGINTRHDGSSQCALLLPCIGTRLKSLRVSVRGRDSSHFRLILDNCPHLRSLDVYEIKRGYLQPIIAALSRPQCGIRSLQLIEWQDRDDAALIKLLNLLADSSSVAAGQLQHLLLNDPGSIDVASSPEIAEALARVVRHNKILLHIEAYLTKQDDLTYQRALLASGPRRVQSLSQLQRRQLQQPGQPVVEEEEVEDDAYNRRVPSPSPLPLRVMCAFLRIFASDTTARYRPGLLVSATIFRFAGETVVRRVVIEYPTVF